MTDAIVFRELPTACGRRIGVATLNAPAALNALSLTMVDALMPRLSAWAADPQVVAVLLDGAGDKAFCAGGDLRELYQSMRDCGSAPNAYAQQFFGREYRLDHLIHTFPKPVLCWGHGIVMGGGMGLMAGASHRVVTEKSRLAMPEIAIGLYPDVAGSWFLRRMPARLGLFLALTGAPMNAADALFAGLADFYLPHERKASLIEALSLTSWHADGTTHAAQLSHVLETLRDDTPPSESKLRIHFDAIQTLMGHDDLPDIARRLAACTASDAWLSGAAQNFLKGSPTSAALAFALWRNVPHLSLAQVFRNEFDASLGCCAHHDFAEGIRALLIDKDRQPRWQPAQLDQVDVSLLEDHFRPRYTGAHPLADLV
ncbi:MAG: enoyl-CoA hydratase/isomerase family protein [Burkholderiales bacterium]|nr:enoyl-CoA hydratase/isomerase family protein [Burkholderiales bacterium]